MLWGCSDWGGGGTAPASSGWEGDAGRWEKAAAEAQVFVDSFSAPTGQYRQVFSMAFQDQLVKALGNADCSDLVSLGTIA
jgi:hypothetical protein